MCECSQYLIWNFISQTLADWPSCHAAIFLYRWMDLSPHQNLYILIFFLNFSSIHDHADSHCFLKVLDGRLKETQFPWPSESEPEKPLEPTGSRFYETNEVNYINGLFTYHAFYRWKVRWENVLQNVTLDCKLAFPKVKTCFSPSTKVKSCWLVF